MLARITIIVSLITTVIMLLGGFAYLVREWRAWRNRPKLLWLVAGLLLCPSVSGAVTYYTGPGGSNSNNCTTAQNINTPKATIGSTGGSGGISCLGAANSELVIRNGTYTEPELSFTFSGSAGNPITIRAENRGLAILATSSCNMGINVNGSYLILDGIRIIMAPGTVCSGGASRTALRLWQQGSLPHITGPATTGYTNNIVRYMTLDYMTSLNTGFKTNQDYTLFEFNSVHMGFDSFNNLGTIIRNNEVWTSQPTGQGAGIGTKGGTRNNEVYNNLVHRLSSDYGIIAGGNSGSTFHWDPSTSIEAYNTAIYNNVILNEGSIANTSLCLGAVGATNAKIFNNVVIGCGFFSDTGGTSGIPQPLPTNITARNNIIVCAGPTGTGPAIGGWNGSAGFTFNYNNFYSCATGGTYGSPTQVNPIVGNPLFVNNLSDWHLQAGSPALNAGTTMTMTGYNGETMVVNLDKVGVARNVPWDLGIYENAGTADTTPPAAPTGLTIIEAALAVLGMAWHGRGLLLRGAMACLAVGVAVSQALPLYVARTNYELRQQTAKVVYLVVDRMKDKA